MWGTARMANLTATAVRAALANPGIYSDGNGLFLKVRGGKSGTAGSAQWFVRIQVDGKRRDYGLGGGKLLSLADARDAARELRKAIKVERRDVLTERRDTGDFRLDDVHDSDGTWSGRVRDVHFDRLELPSAWLSKAHDQTAAPDALKGTLPASATNSDRQHEVAAHEAAQVVRETRCTLAEAIRRIRHLADPKGRAEDSIDWAIRRSYRLMYDLHGVPIKN